MRCSCAMLGAALLVLAGCGDSYDDPFNSSRRKADPGALGVVVDPLETQAAPARPSDDEKQAKPPKSDGGGRDKPEKKKPKPPAEKPVREEAKVGVGDKGSGYGGGIVTTPVSVYFRAQERITFEIQVPQALNLYKASTGSAPKTHEEFMEKIIEANKIDLPRLPSGYRYVYDPQKEQLMVEHPK